MILFSLRVLEVRAYWAGARIAFIAVYQHVWSSNTTQQDNRGDRAAVLSALAVQQVPKRDTLIVAGDFNCSLTTTQSLMGPETAQPEDKRPDEANLTNLARKLGLVALITWHCRSPYIFVQGDARTQIDFILTRGPCSGSQAKQAARSLISIWVAGRKTVTCLFRPLFLPCGTG